MSKDSSPPENAAEERPQDSAVAVHGEAAQDDAAQDDAAQDNAAQDDAAQEDAVQEDAVQNDAAHGDPERSSAVPAAAPDDVVGDETMPDSAVPDPAVSDQPVSDRTVRDDEAPSAHEQVTSWIEALGSGTENDTMLKFTPSQHNAIDLTDANSSGLMQLLTGRKTRLSTLLHEASAYATGKTAAQGIRAKIREMSEDRGIDVGFLAAGVASWTEMTAAGSEQFTAPVMLVPISLRPRAGSEDFELQFTGGARLNPALVRHMADSHGLLLEPAEFLEAGYMTARFDPDRTSGLLSSLAGGARARAGVSSGDRSRSSAAALDSLQVWRQLYVSTFADLADLGNPKALDLNSPLLQAMSTTTPIDQGEVDVDPLDERHPKDELLVADADPDQQAVLDAVLAGHSAVVSAPPGTGQTQTAINAAAGLAWQGKDVLVIAERTQTLEEFSQRLSEVRLGTLAANVPASFSPVSLKDQVIRAIRRCERAEPPRLGTLHAKLTERRHHLTEHVKSLHHERTRWECSPYEAMQALAALTALNPAPATSVRLKRSVLDNTVDRSQVAVKLKRAAELGAFSAETSNSPWFNARLTNRQETRDALKLVRELRAELPKLSQQMSSACKAVGLVPGESFSQWHSQVLLFQRVQESLGKFSHDVYVRPLDDLIAATAPGWWRREHDVEMSSMARSRLRRVAKEYVRSGVSIQDLHTSLADVQAEREQWLEWAEEDSLPKVPKNLDRLAVTMAEVQSRIERLIVVLRPVDPQDPDDLDLADMSVPAMIDTVERLAVDEDPLVTLPERTLLTDQLREQGFRELMDDFAAREVPASAVTEELELAWWQSALEAMISGDDYLAMTTGENLRRAESEFRAADAAHIETGAQRLNHRLALNWKSVVENHPEASAELRGMLRDGEPAVADFTSAGRELMQPLIPIWMTSPLGLVEQFPREKKFDAVVLLDAESLDVPAALGAISRSDQVVAFGDPVSGSPVPFQVSADPVARESEQQIPVSIYAELSGVLPEHQLRRVHRGVDQELTGLLSEALYDGELIRLPDAAELTGQGRRFSVDYLGDSVRPGVRDSVESPTAEVNRVVDAVFDHIRTHRNASLAVITGSAWHARRVADAIRLHLANHPWAKPFFGQASGGMTTSAAQQVASSPGHAEEERFVVAPLERAHGLVRDTVIFSLGFGRSIKGDPAHHFGELSEARGEEYFALAVTRARQELKVVTSLGGDDLTPELLQSGARRLYDLISLGMDASPNPTGSSQLDDPLVLDLVDRIRARGGRVEDGFRGTLDLATCQRRLSPGQRVTPLAMVSDGTSSYAEKSVRERSRQIPEGFESLGWRFMVLWTIEVFSDPVRCTEVVAENVGLAAGPEFAEAGRIPVHAGASGAEHRGAGPGAASGAQDGQDRSAVRFGGAADLEDEDSHRRAKQWTPPRDRGKWAR